MGQNSCGKCHPNCKKCKGPANINCTICNNSSHVILKDGQCGEPPPNTFCDELPTLLEKIKCYLKKFLDFVEKMK